MPFLDPMPGRQYWIHMEEFSSRQIRTTRPGPAEGLRWWILQCIEDIVRYDMAHSGLHGLDGAEWIARIG